MIELTTTARTRLERYLSDLRASLAGCPNVDRVDVESDVMQHIETSLATAAVPVDVQALSDVLQRLGSPSQWVPKEDLSWFRRQFVHVRQVLEYLRHGPEDFRLSYITVFLLGLAMVLLPVVPPVPSMICILFSFFFARSALAFTSSPAELGAQRWLLYPTLVIVCGSVLVGLMIWPSMLAACWGTETKLDAVWVAGPVPIWLFATYLAWTGTSLWFLLAGVVSWRWPGLVRQVFYPFANGFKARHGFWFSVISLLMLAAAITVAALAVFGERTV